MNVHDLRRYLGLDVSEFAYLLAAQPDALERYAPFVAASDNLEQLPSRYNRPPAAPEDDPVHAELDAVSRAAFARLEALIAEHEAFRRSRTEPSSGRRRVSRGGRNYGKSDAVNRARRDPLCNLRSESGDTGTGRRRYDGPDGIFEDYEGMDSGMDCTQTSLRLAAKVKNLGQRT